MENFGRRWALLPSLPATHLVRPASGRPRWPTCAGHYTVLHQVGRLRGSATGGSRAARAPATGSTGSEHVPQDPHHNILASTYMCICTAQRQHTKNTPENTHPAPRPGRRPPAPPLRPGTSQPQPPRSQTAGSRPPWPRRSGRCTPRARPCAGPGGRRGSGRKKRGREMLLGGRTAEAQRCPGRPQPSICLLAAGCARRPVPAGRPRGPSGSAPEEGPPGRGSIPRLLSLQPSPAKRCRAIRLQGLGNADAQSGRG